MLADPAVYDAAQDTPYKRGHDEQPKLADGPTSYKRAGPMLRAGLTDVLVTGMLIRWINVRPSPIAMGAKPTGAFPCVEPMIMNRNIMVITTSVRKQDSSP